MIKTYSLEEIMDNTIYSPPSVCPKCGYLGKNKPKTSPPMDKDGQVIGTYWHNCEKCEEGYWFP